MSISRVPVAAAMLLALCSPAGAAEYLFSFETSQRLFGGAVMGEGVFTTSDVAMQVGGETAFAVTSIRGTVNGSAIVAPVGNYGNYFTTGGEFLDGSGLRFFTAARNDVRIFFQDSVGRYRVNTFSPGSSNFVTARSAFVAAVPEPESWAMMIIGFGATGVSLRSARTRKTGVLQPLKAAGKA